MGHLNLGFVNGNLTFGTMDQIEMLNHYSPLIFTECDVRR